MSYILEVLSTAFLLCDQKNWVAMIEFRPMTATWMVHEMRVDRTVVVTQGQEVRDF